MKNNRINISIAVFTINMCQLIPSQGVKLKEIIAGTNPQEITRRQPG